jgi:tight adherence protein C
MSLLALSDTMLTAGMGGFAVSVGLIAYVVGTQLEDRKLMRASLSRLDGDVNIASDNTRETDLLKPLQARLGGSLSGLVSLGRKLTPVGYVETIRRKFVQAGDPSPDSVDRFLAVKVLCTVALPFALIGTWMFVPVSGILRYAAVGIAGFVLWAGPDSTLNKKIQARQLSIRRALPETMDLLVISVEAGLGFEQALQRVVSAVPGPLSQEFNRMLGEVRAGSSRAEALRAMQERIDLPEVNSFVMAILQADTFGVSIGRILRGQADEMRIKRRQIAQEKAMKAPVKMLLPMTLCIFPCMFLVVIGPAAINISNGL